MIAHQFESVRQKLDKAERAVRQARAKKYADDMNTIKVITKVPPIMDWKTSR